MAFTARQYGSMEGVTAVELRAAMGGAWSMVGVDTGPSMSMGKSRVLPQQDDNKESARSRDRRTASLWQDLNLRGPPASKPAGSKQGLLYSASQGHRHQGMAQDKIASEESTSLHFSDGYGEEERHNKDAADSELIRSQRILHAGHIQITEMGVDLQLSPARHVDDNAGLRERVPPCAVEVGVPEPDWNLAQPGGLRVQRSTLWVARGPIHLYGGAGTGDQGSQEGRFAVDDLHRRHFVDGTTGARNNGIDGSSLAEGEDFDELPHQVWVEDQLQKVPPDTATDDGFPGIQHSVRCSPTEGTTSDCLGQEGKPGEAVERHNETGKDIGNSISGTSRQAKLPDKSGRTGTVMHEGKFQLTSFKKVMVQQNQPLHRGARGARMVATAIAARGRERDQSRAASDCAYDGRSGDGLGRMDHNKPTHFTRPTAMYVGAAGAEQSGDCTGQVRREHGQQLVQFQRVDGGNSRSQELPREATRLARDIAVGQQHIGIVRKQMELDERQPSAQGTRTEPVMFRAGHSNLSGTFAWIGQRSGGQTFEDARHGGLAAKPGNMSGVSDRMGSNNNRPLCITGESSGAKVQLNGSGSRDRGSGRFSSVLAAAPSDRSERGKLGKPALPQVEPGYGTNHTAKGGHNTDNARVAAREVVQKVAGIRLSEDQVTSCKEFIPGFRYTGGSAGMFPGSAVGNLRMESLLLKNTVSWSTEAKEAVVESLSATTRKLYKSAIARCLLWHLQQGKVLPPTLPSVATYLQL